MTATLFVQGNEEEKSALRDFIKNCNHAPSRQRAQAILWSMEGRQRKDLASLFHVKPDTISDWFKRWDPSDFSKLKDKKGRGRPSLLSAELKKTS